MHNPIPPNSPTQFGPRFSGEDSTNPRIALYIALCASLVGIIVAAYLTYAQLSVTPGVCYVNRWFNCDAVITSQYSKIYGIPMAIFGLIWFTGSALFSLALLQGVRLLRAMILWGALGVLGVVYLNYVELGILHTVCLYCLSTHILGITFLIATLVFWKIEAPTPEGSVGATKS